MAFVPLRFLPLKTAQNYHFSQGVRPAVIFQLPAAKVNQLK